MGEGSVIDIASERLFQARALKTLSEKLGAQSDISVAAPISARPFLVAAGYKQQPRSTLIICNGEVQADHFARELRTWLPGEAVLRLPLYSHRPWREQALSTENIAQSGARVEALVELQSGQPQLVVASVQSLLRKLPPPAALPQPIQLTENYVLPGSLGYEGLKTALVNCGYERTDRADAPGYFSLRGDTLDLWPSTTNHPLRIELFGDEVEKIRRLVPSTGQSIGTVESITVYPAKAVVLNENNRERAIRRIYGLSPQELKTLPAAYAEHLAALQSGQDFLEQELYLPYLYDKPAVPLDYLHSQTLLIAIEPRALFDAAAQYYDQQMQSIVSHCHDDNRAEALTEALFLKPGDLDFGIQQLFTILTMISGSSGLDLRLEVKYPAISGSEQRLALAAKNLLSNDYMTIIAAANQRSQSAIELALTDEHVSFSDATKLQAAQAAGQALQKQVATICEMDLPTAMTIPAAKLALLSLSDNSASSIARRVRSSRSISQAGGGSGDGDGSIGSSSDGSVGGSIRGGRTSADPTALTFPFKPGDYVVHEVHGIALFKAIVKQEVAGIERDYLHLEYAQGDKLYTPVEQINRVSRYIGPNSSAPRLTRLNTSDWSRATGKARKAAKQLAFDLVDLYARRAAVQGYAYGADSDLQFQMELAFPYQETPDQLAAIADVKADMQSFRPMDRLICGDVGFGKTEVALRAAFKAIQAGRQVLLLAPTTILAQQHYTTFLERFDPFAVSVDVLSRFRTEAEQKHILERLAAGKLDLLVGTHRLLSADVNPRDLGLIIIDEEQRFGVQHKEQLKNLREQVDVLTLSATPIPRTLQMALSGVRDMSLINTPPVSRTPVRVQVGEWNEDTVSAAIRHEIGRGGQVYYVSNRVKTIEDAVARVFAVAPEAQVGVAHGRLTSRQLEDVMERFAAQEFDVLIATTIIESGLDNPHTNTLIIEDSQRLGLAQLYQLKGRVGRSHAQAFAYFLFPAENTLTPEAIERLMAIDEFQDLGSGLKIAMRDLEIRGAGSLLGAEQSGNIAAVGFDFFAAMINEAVQAARAGELAEAALEGDEVSLGASKNPKLEVRIELPEPCFFAEEYMAGADQRVLFYRRLAATEDFTGLDALVNQLESEFGALPAAAMNLVDRERARIWAVALDISSISVQRKHFVLENLHLNSEQASELKKQGGLYFVKSYRLQYPFEQAPKASKGQTAQSQDAVASITEASTGSNSSLKQAANLPPKVAQEGLYPQLINLLEKLADIIEYPDDEDIDLSN
ncbi:MAG: transcription-repair coupling factor [Coriobacteriales bacterium]|jgi:transcription-repair coupling factor (superfamily II helicase)|nr:transcription-repair coupling factor [Coriobacteriales bacterium]